MLSGDPREALLSELATPGGARLEGAALSSTPQILQAVYADELRRKMERGRAADGPLRPRRPRARRGFAGGPRRRLAAFETELGPRWKDTVLVAIAKFGRTARINGTVGADHGIATVAFLAGGVLAGGRVVADWPGLKTADLYEERDLKATTDLRAVLKGELAEHPGLSAGALARVCFPIRPASSR